jgi:hypothetical protein
MIPRIRRFYPAPAEIARGRDQFGAFGHQQLLKLRGAEQAIVLSPADPRICQDPVED